MTRDLALGLARILVPQPLRPHLRHAWTRLRNIGGALQCPVCSRSVRHFLAHGIPPEPSFLCPFCSSKPPHRLASIYFDTHRDLFRPDTMMVHIAPEPGLSAQVRALTARAGMTYRSGSISGTGDQYLDLLRLPFADASVHLMYCCHVLNSLQEDLAAMREVARVLHPQGTALLQVPAFHGGPTTLETFGHDERIRVFGDDGIYRCYTDADYIARLDACGFSVSKFTAADVPAEVVARHQLKAEVLHVCRLNRGAT